MKIIETEYLGEILILKIGDNQFIEVFPDMRIPIDKKREYKVHNVLKDKINLGIYKKGRLQISLSTGVKEFLEIIEDHAII